LQCEKNTYKEKPFDKDVKAKPGVESAKSSDLTTAYYKDGKIVVLKDETVTFDVKFVGVKDSVKVTVDVVKEQTMKPVKGITEKIEAESNDAKVAFTVYDQNGDTYLTADKNVF